MELIAFLFILAFVLLFMKALGLILKAGFFILSIPILLIVSFVLAVVIFSLLPVAVVAGALAVVLAPIGLLGPILPLALIALGVFLLVR